MPAPTGNGVRRNVAFADVSDAPTSTPTVITRPRLTDHTHDTPEERSSATSTKLRAHLQLVFGEVTTMISGENDPVMGMDVMHGIPRSLQRKDPLHFLLLKMHIGKHITKNGKKTRGLNLDSRSNMDCADPTAHRQHDSGVWSLVPVDEMLEYVAAELMKNDGRSYDEICPGTVFEYNVFVYDNRQLPMLVYDEPFRIPQPWASASAQLTPESNEDLAIESEDTDTPQHERLGDITVTPIVPAGQQGGASVQKKRLKQRTIIFPNKAYVVRSVFNPIHIIHNIMTNLIARLATKDKWPDEQHRLWDLLEPPTRPWFNGAIPPRTTRSAARSGNADDGDEALDTRTGNTNTAPAVLTRRKAVRSTRIAKASRTEAAAAATPPTRIQPLRQPRVTRLAPLAEARATGLPRLTGATQSQKSRDTRAAPTPKAGPSNNNPGLVKRPFRMRRADKPS
ncbi:hypothetical protein HDZ31DRAFT_69084 [Schizophyllum fasciatum]